jgi:arylformamidase
MRARAEKIARRSAAGRTLIALAAAALVAGSVSGAEPRLGVAYGDGEVTLDFFPALASTQSAERAPLLAFIAGRFWGIEQDSAYPLEQLVAAPLRAQGIAVALIRHRPAPAHTHPAFAQDAASAVAWLVAHAAELGVDAKRIFLAGHASGAHLAALIALDARYLAAIASVPRPFAAR